MAARLTLSFCWTVTCRSLLPSSFLDFLRLLQNLLLFSKNRECVQIQNGNHSSVLRKNRCCWTTVYVVVEFLGSRGWLNYPQKSSSQIVSIVQVKNVDRSNFLKNLVSLNYLLKVATAIGFFVFRTSASLLQRSVENYRFKMLMKLSMKIELSTTFRFKMTSSEKALLLTTSCKWMLASSFLIINLQI